jgi:hypothetical protein
MRTCFALLSLTLAQSLPAAVGERQPVFTLGPEGPPAFLVRNHVETRMVEHADGVGLWIDFSVTDWPNAFFRAPDGVWDWSAWAELRVTLHNPMETGVRCSMRIDNAGADGVSNCNTSSTTIAPHSTAVLACRFNTGSDNDFLWGMRGVPVRGPMPSGPTLDTSRITAFQVFLPRPQEPQSLILLGAELSGSGSPLRELVPLPFVDALGQYMHDDWPGKTQSENELREHVALETAAQVERLAGFRATRDRFGGWAQGPRLEATGWFRTQVVNGKWWLVTPDGHLFFSVGPNCMGTWERTWVSGREDWFEWLPDRSDPLYGRLFSKHSNPHSMAEAIGDEGWAFSFYCANLIRKYGPETWEKRWRENAHRRLQSWGFNTIGNWSQADVLEHSPMPFVVSGGIWGEVREIEGARGYWGRMRDVYDASFAEAVDRSMAVVTEPHRANPMCIGYFIDNELSWETVRRGALLSPADQPCRQEIVRRLQERYGDLRALNAAWNTDAETWDSLQVPATVNGAVTRDLDEFEYAFARRYFQTVQDAIRRHAPHQLYLGCRFSSAPELAVQACTDVVDVVSFNRYETRIDGAGYRMDKPIIIGEFHFGALDRGMFHPGLVAARDQQERARMYRAYVQSVLDAPAFVGCHWFQFIDEPITGRWFDGENYNIGFVTVTDTPYPELVDAAREVHTGMYRRRYGAE